MLVLNEDTILDPACFTELMRAAADPAVGIVGPMVYHHDEPTVIQSAGGLIDRHWHAWHTGQNEDDTGQFPEPRTVDWISGCAILVRRQVIEQVGPLDERFFYYWEETEWCVRAARAGWRIVHVPRGQALAQGRDPPLPAGPERRLLQHPQPPAADVQARGVRRRPGCASGRSGPHPGQLHA